MLQMLLTVVFATIDEFQWAPTLGGECYELWVYTWGSVCFSFNGHPPLGVNATYDENPEFRPIKLSFNGHPPLGVNATRL